MAPGGSGPEPRHPRAVRLSLRLGVQEEPPALRVQPRSAADAAPSEGIHAVGPVRPGGAAGLTGGLPPPPTRARDAVTPRWVAGNLPCKHLWPRISEFTGRKSPQKRH